MAMMLVGLLILASTHLIVISACVDETCKFDSFDTQDLQSALQSKMNLADDGEDVTEKYGNALSAAKSIGSDGLKVFFTGPFNPENVVKHNKDNVPGGTEFRYFNDAQMEASAKMISEDLANEANIQGVYEAYRSLRPFAFRADLWRAMVVWKYGGVYLDAKDVLVRPVTEWLDLSEKDLVLCYDLYGGFYDNQIIAAPARNKNLEVIIASIVENLRKRSYGSRHFDGSKCPAEWTACLDITGPVAYSRALLKKGVRPSLNCLSDHVGGDTQGFHYDRIHLKNSTDPAERKLILVNDVAVHDETHHASGPDYFTLWSRHQVYCDDGAGGGACGTTASFIEAATAAPYWSKVV